MIITTMGETMSGFSLKCFQLASHIDVILLIVTLTSKELYPSHLMLTAPTALYKIFLLSP